MNPYLGKTAVTQKEEVVPMRLFDDAIGFQGRGCLCVASPKGLLALSDADFDILRVCIVAFPIRYKAVIFEIIVVFTPESLQSRVSTEIKTLLQYTILHTLQ